ncbi:MAG: hypothetical protein E6Z15_04385 [Paenibacillus macerans]|nr:hypothetical protein [Paenibacillus macerans]
MGAKSKYEKLLEGLEAAQKIRDEAVIGEEAGQFTQEALDVLDKEISASKEIADVTDSEPSTYDEALTALVSAVKTFNESVIQQPKVQGDNEKEKDNEKEPSPSKIELKGVVLKGWQEGREGAHSIHLKNRIVGFVNGKADVTPELAGELKKAGYIE